MIDIEQLGGRRLMIEGRGPETAASLHAAGQRVGDRLYAFGPEAFELGQTAVVSGKFEFFQTFDSEFVVEAFGKPRSNAGHGGEDGLWVCLALKLFESMPFSGLDQIGDGNSKRAPDGR